MQASTQAVLFDAIAADTTLEDRTGEQQIKPPSAAPSSTRQALRQALPASLPRIERHHEIERAHCECGHLLREHAAKAFASLTL